MLILTGRCHFGDPLQNPMGAKMAPPIDQVAPKCPQHLFPLLFLNMILAERPRHHSYRCLMIRWNLRLLAPTFESNITEPGPAYRFNSCWHPFFAFRGTVKHQTQSKIPPESWQRTSRKQLITNARLQPLRTFCKSRNDNNRNNPETTKSGGGSVRAAWRIGIWSWK